MPKKESKKSQPPTPEKRGEDLQNRREKRNRQRPYQFPVAYLDAVREDRIKPSPNIKAEVMRQLKELEERREKKPPIPFPSQRTRRPASGRPTKKPKK